MRMEQGLVMVCVTMQRSCQRLIREGERIAAEKDAALAVVHVARPEDDLLGNPDEGEALNYLFTVASEAKAQMQVLRSAKIAKSLAQFAKENGATDIVMGQARGRNQAVMRSILGEVERQAPGLTVHVIQEQENEMRPYVPEASMLLEPEPEL